MLKMVFGWLVLAIILTACGGESPEATPATAIPPTATLVPTRVVIWYSDVALTEGLTRVAAAFEAAYPAYTTELTLQDAQTFRATLSEALVAGRGADLIIASPELMSEWLARKELTPIEGQQIRANTGITPPNAFLSGTYNDALYGFPLLLDSAVIYINSDLTSPDFTTFEAFLSAAEGAGAVIDPDFRAIHGWLRQENMILPQSATGELNITPEGATEFFDRLGQLKSLPNVTFTADPTAFSSGQAGFYVGSSRQAATLQATLGDSLVSRKILVQPELASYEFSFPTLMMTSLNATDASLEASRAFIVFVTHPDQQGAFSEVTGFPPMIGGFTENPLLEAIARNAADDQVIPVSTTAFYLEVLPRYNEAITQFLAGELTSAEAAQQVTQGASTP